MKSCCEVNAPPGGCECGRHCPVREERDIDPGLIKLAGIFRRPLRWLQKMFRR